MTRLSQLDPEQRRVVNAILSRARQRRVSFPEKVAAISTGIVEQSLHNRPGGGGSPSGWRQETRGSYPNVNRLNLRGSVDRFFNETAQNRGRYPNFGALAQSVQRSAFPGRYAEHGGEAKQIVRDWAKAHGGPAKVVRAKPGTKTVTQTTTVPGVDRSADRQALMVSYLNQRGNPSALLGLAQGLQGAQDVPGTSKTVRRTVRVRQGVRTAPTGAGGRPRFRGVQFGHGVVAIGKALQKLGLHVGENPHFGGVAPVHHHYGYYDHYHGGAIDVTGNSKLIGQVAAFLAAHKKQLGIPTSGTPNLGGRYGSGVLWQVPGHYDHIHVSASH